MFMAETFWCKQPVAPGLQIRCLFVANLAVCACGAGVSVTLSSKYRIQVSDLHIME